MLHNLEILNVLIELDLNFFSRTNNDDDDDGDCDVTISFALASALDPLLVKARKGV